MTNRFIQLLALQHIDIVDLSRADPLLLITIAREGAPLYEREPGSFDQFCSLAVRRYADTRKFREAEREAIRELRATGRSRD